MAHLFPLSNLLDRTITIDNLPTDVNLVSNLRGDSILPLAALLDHPRFLSLHPTEEQLLAAIAQHSTLRLLYKPDPCVVLPFFVAPNVLIISNPSGAKQAEFRAFLTTVLGHNFFEVHPCNQCSFRVRFADKMTSLCVWRALKYCVFKGKLLSAVPMASLVRVADDEPIRPTPKRLRNDGRVVRKHRNREKMQKAAASRADGSHPAALPMAMANGAPDVPQAVLLEAQALGSQAGKDE
jgi:hypothetical protein